MLTDPAYGADSAFRAGVTAMGLTYAVGVRSTLSLWPPGQEPLPPKPWSGRGRKPSRVRRDADHRPVSAKTLAMALPPEVWRNVSWRSNETLSSRFALRCGYGRRRETGNSRPRIRSNDCSSNDPKGVIRSLTAPLTSSAGTVASAITPASRAWWAMQGSNLLFPDVSRSPRMSLIS